MTDEIASLFVEMSTCQCEIYKKFSLFVRETTSSQTPNFGSYVTVILRAKKRSEIHVAQVTLLVHTNCIFLDSVVVNSTKTLFHFIFFMQVVSGDKKRAMCEVSFLTPFKRDTRSQPNCIYTWPLTEDVSWIDNTQIQKILPDPLLDISLSSNRFGTQ